MKKNTNKKDSNVAELAVLGASLAGMAATAYFFLGPKGKKHQKQAKAWAIKMKGEVVEKMEKARSVSEPVYNQIIDTVAQKYATGVQANSEDVQELAKDLKKHWKTLTSSAKSTKRSVVKSAKKIVKKAKK